MGMEKKNYGLNAEGMTEPINHVKPRRWRLQGSV